MQGKADTAGEAMSVHSRHFKKDMGSSHSSPLTMAKQIQCEQPFHDNHYFPVLLPPGLLPLLFPFQICGCSSSQRLNLLFPPALVLHHSVITASSTRGVSLCCFHQDLICATLHFLLTGLKCGCTSMWTVMLRLEDGL